MKRFVFLFQQGPRQLSGADQKRRADEVLAWARDFAEAVEIARTHPGLHYGASVEVREWAPPLAQPTSQR